MQKMTIETVIETYDTLKALEGQTHKVKFSYAVARNMGFLEGHYKSFKKTAIPVDGYDEFEKERVTLIQKYGKRSAAGTIMVDPRNPNSVMIDDIDSYNKDFALLAEKHKEVILAQKEREKEIQEVLETDVDVQFFQFSYKLLPEHLSPKQLKAFIPMLNDADEMMEDDEEEDKTAQVLQLERPQA